MCPIVVKDVPSKAETMKGILSRETHTILRMDMGIMFSEDPMFTIAYLSSTSMMYASMYMCRLWWLDRLCVSLSKKVMLVLSNFPPHSFSSARFEPPNGLVNSMAAFEMARQYSELKSIWSYKSLNLNEFCIRWVIGLHLVHLLVLLARHLLSNGMPSLHELFLGPDASEMVLLGHWRLHLLGVGSC